MRRLRPGSEAEVVALWAAGRAGQAWAGRVFLPTGRAGFGIKAGAQGRRAPVARSAMRSSLEAGGRPGKRAWGLPWGH